MQQTARDAMHSFECSGAAVPAMQMTDITRVRGKICIVSVHKKTTRSELKRCELQRADSGWNKSIIRKEEFGRSCRT